MSAAPRQLSCNRCNTHKKKCVPIPGGACERCTRIGVADECTEFVKKPRKQRRRKIDMAVDRSRVPSEVASTVSSSTPTLGMSPVPNLHHLLALPYQPVHQFMRQLDASPFRDECALEDPDLYPTIEDFAIVYHHLTVNGSRQMVFSYDADNFLQTFYAQPPLLRLIKCAHAAHHAVPPVPEEVCLSYYQRARKAFLRTMTMETPTLQTVQALYSLSMFATEKGQPVLGKQFLQKGIDLILEMRLDIDPDDSPWLFHLNLSPRQKEERRRAFWSFFLFLKSNQARSFDAIQSELSSARIKPPSAVNDPYPIFCNAPTFVFECHVLDLLAKIKHHHAVPPKSIENLLTSESLLSLHELTTQAYASMPPAYLIIPESDDNHTLSQSDISRFMSQLQHLSMSDQYTTLLSNMYFAASGSMLHRPALFLTSLKSCDPECLTSQQLSLISLSATQCQRSAFTVLKLFSFALLPGVEMMVDTNFAFPAFEALLVCWFLECRMRHVWRSRLELVQFPANLLLQMLQQVLDAMRRAQLFQGAKSETIRPILKSIEAMKCDVVGFTGNEGLEVGNRDVGEVDNLELGMRVMSLVDESRDVLEKEPFSFLGLLGMELGAGLKWKGRTEESWSLFWKLRG